MATKEQLEERWFTSEGKKIKKKVIKHIKENNWEGLLTNFFYVNEIGNGKDLRFIDLSEVNLEKAYLRGARLWGADLRGARLEGANLREANLEGET
jgi:uncharacterized protein YjbI with pentapeptide repeats